MTKLLKVYTDTAIFNTLISDLETPWYMVYITSTVDVGMSACHDTYSPVSVLADTFCAQEVFTSTGF